MNLDSVQHRVEGQNLPRSAYLGEYSVNTAPTEKEDESWAFLKAPRFWAMVIGSVGFYLSQKGFIGEAEMQLILTITAGFIAVRTLDRTVERLT